MYKTISERSFGKIRIYTKANVEKKSIESQCRKSSRLAVVMSSSKTQCRKTPRSTVVTVSSETQ